MIFKTVIRFGSFFEIEVGPAERPEGMILKTVTRFSSFLNRSWSRGAPGRHDFEDSYTF